jgi:hypothetical protein
VRENPELSTKAQREKAMIRIVFVNFIGLALVIGAGLGHGKLTNRWDVPQLDDQVARLATLPLILGDWEGRLTELDPALLPNQAECRGETRRYVHRTTGSVVTVHLACGLRTPTIIHAPDFCYPFQGYEASQPRQHYTTRAQKGTGPAEFWTATYSKPHAERPHHLRLLWSWRGSESWRAPDSPRLSFATDPVLYKLVLVHQLIRADEPLERDPSVELLDALLPEVEKVIPPAA